MKKRRKRPTDQQATLDDLGDIERLATWARRFIAIIGGALLAIFTWLQIREIPLIDVVQNTTPEILIKAALVIYYACWIGGTNFDVRIQQKTYIIDPKRGNITANTIVIVSLFFIVAILLMAVSANEQAFAAVLALFVAFNIIGWRHIVGRVTPIIKATRTALEEQKNYFRLEQLNLVEAYMAGPWQKHRFAAMLLIVAVTCTVAFFEIVRRVVGTAVSLVSDVPLEIISKLLPSICILAFVLAAEGWIWIKRLNIHTALVVMDRLRKNYALVPRAN
jgi:hypothetical protein